MASTINTNWTVDKIRTEYLFFTMICMNVRTRSRKIKFVKIAIFRKTTEGEDSIFRRSAGWPREKVCPGLTWPTPPTPFSQESSPMECFFCSWAREMWQCRGFSRLRASRTDPFHTSLWTSTQRSAPKPYSVIAITLRYVFALSYDASTLRRKLSLLKVIAPGF
jgi:hypothetical protein